MKVNFLNITNLVHQIKIEGKKFKTVYSYNRLGRTTKTKKIKRNPKFFIRDIKNRKFDKISIDGKKFKLKKKLNKFFIEDFLDLIVEPSNEVLDTFLHLRQWLEVRIKKNNWPLDIGASRVPIVTNILKKTISQEGFSKRFKNFISDLRPVTVEDEDEGEIDVLEGETPDLIKAYIKEFGVGEIWGRRQKKINILSVWCCYIQPSKATVYRTDNDRFFVVEHYVMRNDISKKLDPYSNEFRYKLTEFVYSHGKVKGRFIRRKRSVLVDRVTIGVLGWYPISVKGEKFIKDSSQKRRKKK